MQVLTNKVGNFSLKKEVKSEPVLDLICETLRNTAKHELSFSKRNWTTNFDTSCMHSQLRDSKRFSYLLNHFGQHGVRAFSGRHNVTLVQGVTITPPTSYDIEPFKVYATNCYSANESKSHKGSCRFDVVEVMDSNNIPTYQLVMAIFEAQGLPMQFLCLELEETHKRTEDKLMPYYLYGIVRQMNWRIFELQNILRPACFVCTTESKSDFIRWSKGTPEKDNKKGRRKEEGMHLLLKFWCFPYNYCDRSRWLTVEQVEIVHEYYVFDRDAQDKIAKTANIPDIIAPPAKGHRKDHENDDVSSVSSDDGDDV